MVGGTEAEPIYKISRDSFNVTCVVRSITMEDGSVLVLLNDIHERTVEQPSISPKTNRVTGTVRKRDTYQSEIYLSPEDGQRFYDVTDIEHHELSAKTEQRDTPTPRESSVS